MESFVRGGRESQTVFKKVSNGATVGRSARPGARSDAGPPRRRACSFHTSCCLGCCRLSCDGSRERTLCVQLPDASVPNRDVASRSCRYSQLGTAITLVHQELTSAATGDQRWTEIEAGGAFVKLLARVKSVSQPNRQPVTQAETWT